MRRRTTAQALAQRSRIVLECADGHSIMEVSRRLQVTPDTVRTWRRRFLERGLDGLSDEPRPGVPMTSPGAATVPTAPDSAIAAPCAAVRRGGSGRNVASGVWERTSSGTTSRRRRAGASRPPRPAWCWPAAAPVW